MKVKVPSSPSSLVLSPLLPYVPKQLQSLDDVQRDIPRIAKDPVLTAIIEQTLPCIPSTHDLHLGDARQMGLDVPPSLSQPKTTPSETEDS